MEWPHFPKFLFPPGTKGHGGDQAVRGHGIEREVVFLFSGCRSHNVYNSSFKVSDQLGESQIHHRRLEVNMLPCWQLLVTQPQQQRNFLYIYTHIVPLSSGLGRVTMSLKAMVPFWVNTPKHAISCKGHYSSPRAVCELCALKRVGKELPVTIPSSPQRFPAFSSLPWSQQEPPWAGSRQSI